MIIYNIVSYNAINGNIYYCAQDRQGLSQI